RGRPDPRPRDGGGDPGRPQGARGVPRPRGQRDDAGADVSALLRVQDLRAGYDGVPVVRDLDLVVGEGEVVALLGPNGAGKTTSLLTISGILPVLHGSV